MSTCTHTIAAGAHIIHQEKILLLLRNSPPYIWAPPGGRLMKDEPHLEGLCREIQEECNLEIKIWGPSLLHSFMHKGSFLLAIFFVCELKGGTLKLSEEHTNAHWYTLEELEDEFKKGTEIFGKLSDYKRAFRLLKYVYKEEKNGASR